MTDNLAEGQRAEHAIAGAGIDAGTLIDAGTGFDAGAGFDAGNE